MREAERIPGPTRKPTHEQLDPANTRSNLIPVLNIRLLSPAGGGKSIRHRS